MWEQNKIIVIFCGYPILKDEFLTMNYYGKSQFQVCKFVISELSFALNWLDELSYWQNLLSLCHNLLPNLQALHASRLLEQLKGSSIVVTWYLWNWVLRLLEEYFTIRSSQILLRSLFLNLTVPLYHTPLIHATQVVVVGEVEEGETPTTQNRIAVAITSSLQRSITSSKLCTQTERGSSQRWSVSHGATSAQKTGW